MKVDLELLTFIGVLFTLIISIFSIWDRVKPKFPLFSVHLLNRELLEVKNLGEKRGKIFNIEVNKNPINTFSIDKRNFPLILERNGKIEYRIHKGKSAPIPVECTITFKHIFWKNRKTFSL
jgi:hypothetical protein